MAANLHDRIHSKIQSLPAELRSVAEKDLSLLSTKTKLTRSALSQSVADPALDPQLRAIAAWTIGLVGEVSLAPALEQVARSSIPRDLLWEIAKALCSLNRGYLLFRDLLRSEADEVKHVAAYALGRLGKKDAERDLCQLLLSPEEQPFVRGQAAESLGNLALKSSLPSLLKSAEDPVPEVRFWVAFALGKIGDRRAEAVLAKMAENDHASVDGWWEVSREAEQALEEIRGRS